MTKAFLLYVAQRLAFYMRKLENEKIFLLTDNYLCTLPEAFPFAKVCTSLTETIL